jgi:hypothetical protein
MKCVALNLLLSPFCKALYPDRVQVNVTGQDGKVCLLFNKDAPVSSLVEGSYASAAAVKVTGVGDIEVTHEFAEVAERGLHQEVEMIVHENIGVELG